MLARNVLNACLGQAAAAAIGLLVVSSVAPDQDSIAFVLAAIVGSQIGAYLHAKEPGSANTLRAKLILGGGLAVTALVVSAAAHVLFQPFRYGDVTIPIATMGSSFFPFAVFSTMFKAVKKSVPAGKAS